MRCSSFRAPVPANEVANFFGLNNFFGTNAEAEVEAS